MVNFADAVGKMSINGQRCAAWNSNGVRSVLSYACHAKSADSFVKEQSNLLLKDRVNLRRSAELRAKMAEFTKHPFASAGNMGLKQAKNNGVQNMPNPNILRDGSHLGQSAELYANMAELTKIPYASIAEEIGLFDAGLVCKHAIK